MFWIITGIVIAVLLLGAWLWDRKHGFDATRMDGRGSDDGTARADAHNSQRHGAGGMPGF